MNPPISALLEKARHTSDLSHEELVRLLSLSDTELPALMAAANEVRQKTVGNQVHLRGIIEFSNYCKQHCCYCGLRADNGAYRTLPAHSGANFRNRRLSSPDRLPHPSVAKRRRPAHPSRNHCGVDQSN